MWHRHPSSVGNHPHNPPQLPRGWPWNSGEAVGWLKNWRASNALIVWAKSARGVRAMHLFFVQAQQVQSKMRALRQPPGSRSTSNAPIGQLRGLYQQIRSIRRHTACCSTITNLQQNSFQNNSAVMCKRLAHYSGLLGTPCTHESVDEQYSGSSAMHSLGMGLGEGLTANSRRADASMHALKMCIT
jgi:hypothetical protein